MLEYSGFRGLATSPARLFCRAQGTWTSQTVTRLFWCLTENCGIPPLLKKRERRHWDSKALLVSRWVALLRPHEPFRGVLGPKGDDET